MRRRYVSRLSRRSRSRAPHDSPRPPPQRLRYGFQLPRCLPAQLAQQLFHGISGPQGIGNVAVVCVIWLHAAKGSCQRPEWGRTFAGFDSPAARHPKWGCRVRTRLTQWLERKERPGKRTTRITLRVLYGVAVLYGGKWHQCSAGTKPFLTPTLKRAEAMRAKLRLVRA
jgi:hypothetical protein